MAISIPSSGYLKKIYFNTSISKDDVVEVLSQLTYSDGSYYICVSANNLDKKLTVLKNSTYYSIVYSNGVVPFVIFTTDPTWSSIDPDITDTGWNPKQFSNPLEFNDDVDITNSNGEDVGLQNELLTSFISVYEAPPLEEFLTGIANSIREVKGTTDKINALTFEDEIRKFKGGSSGVIEVDELPTENIDENAIYKVNKVTDIDVYVKTGTNLTSTLFQAVASLGVTPTITYYLVDSLPESPNVSNLVTFSALHIYIYNDVAYGYGNVGYGNMWVGVKDLVTSATGISHDNKGYCPSPSEINEQGIYVTYKTSTIGVNSSKSSLKTYDSDWIDYKSIFDKTITSFSNTKVKEIYDHQFYGCHRLKNINLPNVTKVYSGAFFACIGLETVSLPNATEIRTDVFEQCVSLKTINIPNVTKIENSAFNFCTRLETISLPNVTYIGSTVFDQCSSLKSIILSNSLTTIGYDAFYRCTNLKDVYYMGTEAEWNAISIAGGNEALTSATIHYNYVLEE